VSASGRQTAVLHGRRLAYRRFGDGPAVLLIHGILSSSDTWSGLLAQIAEAGFEVIAPDLPGYGSSQRLRGDHSIGAIACILRDLLDLLDVPRATVVGHSLGGGIAMQFSYQFPERTERLVLVASGGLGREVSPLVRAATLGGAERVIALAAAPPFRQAFRLTRGIATRIGLLSSPDSQEIVAGLGSLASKESRAGFVRTTRAVVSPGGQRVSALDRLYLAAHVPVLIVHGTNYRIIPVEHAREAAAAVPHARLEFIEDAGHFPHLDDPEAVTMALLAFLSETEPARYDSSASAALLRAERSAP
jgi:pimeloyl-ACP methyl ester carboxylesterase